VIGFAFSHRPDRHGGAIAWPILQTIWFSFRDNGAGWVGLHNYGTMFSDSGTREASKQHHLGDRRPWWSRSSVAFIILTERSVRDRVEPSLCPDGDLFPVRRRDLARLTPARSAASSTRGVSITTFAAVAISGAAPIARCCGPPPNARRI
jgi:ABC-type sugar transport system permease subunit